MRAALAAAKHWLSSYLASDDPFAAIANTGAFIVWSHQPIYPLYCAWFVGRDAWPSLLTWFSTPFFAAVPIIAREKGSLAGRCLFLGAGLANELVALKAMGAASGVGWFILPCFVIALTFFRAREWRASVALTILTGLCALAIGRLGAPLHVYTEPQNRGLAELNFYGALGISLYLVVAIVRTRFRASDGDVSPA
jgi:hypothetical protein